MKKLLTLLLATVFILSVSSIFVSAEDTYNPDGYKFDIKAINGIIEGEDGIIITKQEAIANANLKWPIIIICEKVSDGVYKVKQEPITTQGTAPDLKLNKDEIIIAIHSNTSKIEMKDTYKNVEQKLTAKAVKPGMYFTFEGIDLEKGTCNNGKAVCSAKALDGTSTPTESSAAASAPAESSAATSSTTSSTASSTVTTDNSKEASSETKTNTSSAGENSKPASSGITSEIEADSGLDTTTIIIIIAAVVVVAVVLVIIFTRKKK